MDNGFSLSSQGEWSADFLGVKWTIGSWSDALMMVLIQLGVWVFVYILHWAVRRALGVSFPWRMNSIVFIVLLSFSFSVGMLIKDLIL